MAVGYERSKRSWFSLHPTQTELDLKNDLFECAWWLRRKHNLPEGRTLSYLWNFGGESISVERNPIHRYAEYGTYTVSLTVTDDEETSDMYSINITIIKIPSSLTCSVSSSEVTEGESITVSGSISPPVSDVIVTVTYTKPEGSTYTRTCTTNPGDYSDTYTPDSTGAWRVIASWTGDATYTGASSSSISFAVTKISTTLSCIISSSEITEGDSITISGAIGRKILSVPSMLLSCK